MVRWCNCCTCTYRLGSLGSFKSLWPHMLITFTSEFQHVLRLVVIMLLIPLDDSEAERVFSLMNDIKTAERSTLGQLNLAALMIWHYYGKSVKPWDLPVQEILKEFHGLVTDQVRGRAWSRASRCTC